MLIINSDCDPLCTICVSLRTSDVELSKFGPLLMIVGESGGAATVYALDGVRTDGLAARVETILLP